MSGPVLAILLTVAVHIIGAIALIWAMGFDELRGFFSTGGERGGGTPPEPVAPVPPRSGGGVPLPDAVPARVRLRDEQLRLGELRRRAPRRPAHAPAPAPVPEREPGKQV